MREIGLARERIANGSCANCGVDIDARRLLAQLTASRRIRCQAEAERQPPATLHGSSTTRRRWRRGGDEFQRSKKYHNTCSAGVCIALPRRQAA